MCTIFSLHPLNLLSKNRDKENATPEEVVVEAGVLAVRAVGSDYYSLAVNRHGVAFASTAVNSVGWTRAVEEGRTADALALMAEERRGLTSPTALLSQSFADQTSIDMAQALLATSGKAWMGYNVILADRRETRVIEHFSTASQSFGLPARGVVTNHFRHLGHGAKVQADYPSSFQRFDYASRKIATIQSLDDLKEAVNPTDPAEAALIWRAGAFRTISATIIDIDARALWRSDAHAAPWQRFDLA